MTKYGKKKQAFAGVIVYQRHPNPHYNNFGNYNIDKRRKKFACRASDG